MGNIVPKKPSFIINYWRPLDEKSNFWDSWQDYTKDVSLVRYSADTIGQYIQSTSREHLGSINNLANEIGIGFNSLSNEIGGLANLFIQNTEELFFLNRKADIQIEQQKLTNILLQNISELLKVPDYEKERLRSIELGIKFMVNAKKDQDLYADALEEFLKAEQLMKQDYFVLHRLGMIYLYSPKHVNPQKSVEYFMKAAKYASVEIIPKSEKASEIQDAKNTNTDNAASKDLEQDMQHLVSDSYEKAAFSAYILGDFELAEECQNKAYKYNNTSENLFLLAKYQIRNKHTNTYIANLSKSIEQTPKLALAVFNDLDFINQPSVLKLIEEKNKIAVERIKNEIAYLDTFFNENNIWIGDEERMSPPMSGEVEAKEDYSKLQSLLNSTIDKRIEHCASREVGQISIEKDVKALIKKVKDSFFGENSEKVAEEYLDFLNNKIQSTPYPFQIRHLEDIKEEIECRVIKIGSYFAGGIVFYLDESMKHGLICAPVDQGSAGWGSEIILGTQTKLGTGKSNTKLIVEKASSVIEKGFFSSKAKPIQTAARICAELSLNGHNDWFLPSYEELGLLYEKRNIIENSFYVSNDWTQGASKVEPFRNYTYWSSSEHPRDCSQFAYGIDFGVDYPGEWTHKGCFANVYTRAIRTF